MIKFTLLHVKTATLFYSFTHTPLTVLEYIEKNFIFYESFFGSFFKLATSKNLILSEN